MKLLKNSTPSIQVMANSGYQLNVLRGNNLED